MTSSEIMAELKSMGSEQYKKIFISHGANGSLYGVKIEDLKKIQKRVKKDYQLSLELYNTGNSDAMYLAGLISDPEKMTRTDLDHWAENATWYMISEYTVPWTAGESKFAEDLAKDWMQSDNEKVQCAGWNTISGIISMKPNEELDLDYIKSLVEFVGKNIHQAKNRVRYTMNGFLISAGGYIPELRELAIETSKKIGKIHVDMGGTACKIPSVPEYIEKMVARGAKKRKTLKC
jgi:3-methyladenine DNA glycosylase AlkD